MVAGCDHCRDLEARVSTLEGMLGVMSSGSVYEALRHAIGLTAQQALIVAHLYGAKGRAVETAALEEAAQGGRWAGSLVVQISRIRKAIGAQSIATRRGPPGYSLTPAGLAVVNLAIRRGAQGLEHVSAPVARVVEALAPNAGRGAA